MRIYTDSTKEEVKKIRIERGLSYKEISDLMNIPKGTIYSWIKDVQLNEEQKEKLNKRTKKICKFNALKGAHANYDKWREKRLQYQNEGRQKAKEKNSLHMMGCMLYWAEGTKTKNRLVFSNIDTEMLLFFLKFLRQCYNIQNENIKIHCNTTYYSNRTVEEIEDYWEKTLNLPKKCFLKTSVADRGHKKIKYRDDYYGVCSIVVCNVTIIQNIYGAIKEYAGIDDEEKWLY